MKKAGNVNMTDRCRWYSSAEVPGGRYLVPGCWNRTVCGDYAECHCPKPKSTDSLDGLADRIKALEDGLSKLIDKIEKGRAPG
jgi:hypothetical protein